MEVLSVMRITIYKWDKNLRNESFISGVLYLDGIQSGT